MSERTPYSRSTLCRSFCRDVGASRWQTELPSCRGDLVALSPPSASRLRPFAGFRTLSHPPRGPLRHADPYVRGCGARRRELHLRRHFRRRRCRLHFRLRHLHFRLYLPAWPAAGLARIPPRHFAWRFFSSQHHLRDDLSAPLRRDLLSSLRL